MSNECKFEGCTSPVNARGWCSTHYGRWSKTGSPERTCAGCGTPVADGRTKWCSKACKPDCSFDGCRHKAYSKAGLCGGHERQLRTEGELRPFKFERPDAGGDCVICNAQIEAGKRRRTCSVACRQRLYHHGGERPKEFDCKGCGKSVSLVFRNDRGHLLRSDSKWCTDCLRDTNAYRRMVHYGVTPERFQRAIADGCDICGKTGINLHVDHDHSCCPGGSTCGNCVRGFLCGPCNRGIGMLKEDADVLLSAAAYVLKSRNVLDTSGGAACPS